MTINQKDENLLYKGIWETRPDPSKYEGSYIFVVDIGLEGAEFKSDGVKWILTKPVILSTRLNDLNTTFKDYAMPITDPLLLDALKLAAKQGASPQEIWEQRIGYVVSITNVSREVAEKHLVSIGYERPKPALDATQVAAITGVSINIPTISVESDEMGMKKIMLNNFCLATVDYNSKYIDNYLQNEIVQTIVQKLKTLGFK